MRFIKSIILFFATLPLYGAVTCSPVCVDVDTTVSGVKVNASYGRPKLVFTVSDLEDGPYRVTLGWMEWVYSAPGKRPLTVSINDSQVLKGFDIFSAGGFLTMVRRSFVVFPVDGKITITIVNDIGNSAILNELSVRPLLQIE